MANAFAILGRNTTKPMQADLADLQAQKAATRVNLSHAKLYEQQAAKAEADAKAEQETINAFKQMGMNPTPEAIAQLSTVNPLAAQRMQQVVSKQAQDKLAAQKAALDAEEASIKTEKAKMDLAFGKAKTLSRILSTVTNPQELQVAAMQAMNAGVFGDNPEQAFTQAVQMASMPWDRFVTQQPQLVQVGQTIEERQAQADKQFASDQARVKATRDALLFPVELATKQAGQTVAQNQAVTTAPNAQGLTPAQAAADERAKIAADRQSEQFEETKRHNRASEGLIARGQNMTDERAKEAREQKPLNEYETRNFGFYDRARQSTQILNSLDEKIRQKGLLGQARLKFAPNVMQSEENQSYDQAKRQFIAAYLRRDSGAVITPSEIEEADRTFFVQPGDPKALIEQKRKARETVLNGLKAGAGRAPERLGVADEAKPKIKILKVE